VIAGVLALLLLFVVRPPRLRAFRRGGDPTLSNVDALPGLTGTVIKDFADARGQVKLANGETWTARLADSVDGELVEGERVVVTAIEGATALVVPAPVPRKEGLTS
jgi:membrane protein implicated in regulation of membrane protease activity